MADCPIKTFAPEQVMTKLRQIEVLVGRARRCPRLARKRVSRPDVLSVVEGVRRLAGRAGKEEKERQKENAQLRRAIPIR